MTPEEWADSLTQCGHVPDNSACETCIAALIRQALAEEREACARIVEGSDRDAKRHQIADAIRLRH